MYVYMSQMPYKYISLRAYQCTFSSILSTAYHGCELAEVLDGQAKYLVVFRLPLQPDCGEVNFCLSSFLLVY